MTESDISDSSYKEEIVEEEKENDDVAKQLNNESTSSNIEQSQSGIASGSASSVTTLPQINVNLSIGK